MKGSEWWAVAPSDLASEEYAAHVLDAVDRGLLYWQWRDLQVGPLTVQCMAQPLAVGTAEDRVHLYGMTAALMDQVVELWNFGPLHEDDRRRGVPREIMPLTSLLLDAMAAHEDAVLVGPFIQQQPPAKNRKEHAKLHSDKLLNAQHHKPRLGASATDHFWPECKTYVLNPRHRPGYAWEYGWHVRSGWSRSATAEAIAANIRNEHAPRVESLRAGGWLYDGLHRGRVIQPEQRAHYGSQDYSMAALFVSAYGVLSHPAKHGRTRVERVDLRQLLADPERCHLVTVHGPQGWHTLGGPR